MWQLGRIIWQMNRIVWVMVDRGRNVVHINLRDIHLRH